MLNVLVVEDDSQLRVGLTMLLESERYCCVALPSVEAVYRHFGALSSSAESWADLCILDLGLPGRPGSALCTQLRQQNPLLPIIFLSAKASTRDRIAGLKAGADDYLAKPFDPQELLVRLAAIRRRIAHGATGKQSSLRFLSLSLNPQKHSLCGELGAEVGLTPRELALLRLLFSRPELAVARQDLYNVGWGYHSLPNSRVLDQAVVELRKKIRNASGDSPRILSVRGSGYRLAP